MAVNGQSAHAPPPRASPRFGSPRVTGAGPATLRIMTLLHDPGAYGKSPESGQLSRRRRPRSSVGDADLEDGTDAGDLHRRLAGAEEQRAAAGQRQRGGPAG